MTDKWLTKDELIAMTGMSKRTLQSLLSAGKCRFRDEETDTPKGKRIVVLIDPFSLPSIYKDKYVAAQVEQAKREPGADLSEYADWQIRTAIERASKLQDIRGALVDFKDKRINRLQTTGYLKQLCANRGISIHTYYRLDKNEKEGGLGALVPGWGTKSGQLKDFNTEQKQFLIAVYGDQAQPKIAECCRMLADYSRENGLPAPSISTARSFIADLPENFRDLHRKGDKYYDDKHRFHILRDYTDLKSNAIWCSDHHQLNIYVADYDGRKGFPWFTVWQDLASRKIMGWWLQVRAGNSRTIAGAFRRGVLEHGIPERVYVDNGKDYRSKMIGGGAKRIKKARKAESEIRSDIDVETKGIFMELGVKPIYAWPYHPQSKPTERFFRTLDEQFSKKFEGYRGHNVASRPERVDEHIANGKKNGKVMHISELSELLLIYISERYNIAPHRGDGMDGRSPTMAWQDKLETPHVLRNPVVLDLLMMPVERKKVGRIGVRLFGGNYYHADMFMYKGKEVDVRYDVQDLSKILVFEPNGKKICEAVNQERMSWNPSKEDIDRLQAIRKQEKNALKDVYKFAKERVELPDLRKRIKAGYNSYAGPVESVDRVKIEPEEVETRFDSDCEKGTDPILRLPKDGQSVNRVSPLDESGRDEESVGGSDTLRNNLQDREDLFFPPASERQTNGQHYPLPLPTAVDDEGDEEERADGNPPLQWKTFPEDEDEEE